METAVVGSLQGTEAGSLLVAGVPTEGSETASVVFPYDGSEIGRVWLAGEELLARALAAAAAAEAEIAAIPSFRRAEILARAAELMRGREDELARQTTLETGNPLDPETVVGGLIDEAAAEKAIDLVEEARRAGAEVLCGGTREGTVVAPTLLLGAAEHLRVYAEEAFAPIIALAPYSDVDEVLAGVNDSRFGLQVGPSPRTTSGSSSARSSASRSAR